MSHKKIVISGISGSFPNCRTVDEFGRNLNAKVLLTDDDDRRWNLNHPEICNYSGKIYDLEKFDAGYFGLHCGHVHTLDPLSRMFLEKSIEAILDSGVNPKELEGTRTGVYVGVCYSESEQACRLNLLPNCSSFAGSLRSIIPHRVSYFLKLQGPSHTADTACSSSLFALEHAVRAIRNGECDKAIVGGCNLCLHPYYSLQFSKLGLLNKDGKCKTFDDSADGYTRSETIAAVFLQKADDAKRVYCEVVHAKTNCDGYKEEGITYPSSETQKDLMQEVYEECKVDPIDLSYLEAHGTGTVVGDPQELEAIRTTFLEGRDRPLLIGSVKSNAGHSEPASGLVSIAKAILAMETGLIPPNLNYKTPRKEVKSLISGMLKVVTEPTPFEDDRGLIGVNSFGFGGGNCHTLLRWNPKTKLNGGNPKDDLPRLVCVSGRNEEAINCILDDIKSRPLDAEHVGLIHEIFKIEVPENYYRGYSIVSKFGEVTRSLKVMKKSTLSIYLVFSDFGNQWFQNLIELIKCEIIKSSMELIITTASKLELSLDKMLKNANSGLEIIGSAILQLALVDTIKTLNLKFDGVFASDILSEVACNYYKGEVTLIDCLIILKKFVTYESLKVIENNISGIQQKSTRETLSKSSKIVLEVGKESLSVKRDYNEILICDSVQSFLNSLGRLYELGQTFNVSKLYPPIKYPVSRGTPMISHLIKWNHSKDWFVAKYESMNSFTKQFSGSTTLSLDLETELYKYVKEHVIDGRILFPATGYLYLIWEMFAKSQGMITEDVPIVLENCKFTPTVRFGTSTKAPKLSIMIERGSGHFEITHDDAIVVSGQVRSPISDEELEFVDLPEHEISTSHTLDLTSRDFYKELRLRGYNYKDLFKSVVECNGAITKAKIRWHQNWVAFLDNMLQITILLEDSRLLKVPTEIKRIIVNPKRHQNYADSLGTDPEIPVMMNKQFGVIKSFGIQISGITTTSISRRKPADPLIQTYLFVPNNTILSLKVSAKVNIQIVIENQSKLRLKIVELIDDATQPDSELLCPLLRDVLTNFPLIQPECIILSKHQDLECHNVAVSAKEVSSQDDCDLVVISGGLQRPQIMQNAFMALKPNGFVITREKLNFPLNQDDNIRIITIHTTATERIILIRKKVNIEINPIVVDVTAKDLSWVTDLQKHIGKNKTVLLLSQDSNSGILGLTNCIRRENNGDKISCVFVQDDAPQFDMKSSFYSEQLKLGLALNVFKNGKWGTYRHLDLGEPQKVKKEHSYLNTLEKGDLSSLRWIEGPLKATDGLEGNKELVQIYYASLNFRDIITAIGRISVDFLVKDRLLQEIVQGTEFTGRTSDGRRVFGMVSGGALSNLVAADFDTLIDVPEDWSMEEAATVPAVYSTVIYAVLVVTTIKRGDRILIHSGTGGIGLAAITLALHYGCEVFTTVSSEEKRDFLKNQFPQLKGDHIGNSRDISFEEMVKTQTNGRGVDFVLNSLVEEKLEASVRCLAHGGQFLEIGKFDISNNKALQLLLLTKEASFHGITLDSIILGGREQKLRIFNELRERIAEGSIKPIPRTIFKENQAEEAYRYMATGKHIGKVLIQIRPEENSTINTKIAPGLKIIKALPKYWCNPDKSYVLIGGLGGFGMELADWLVLRGARKLTLTSRRGISTGYQTYRMNLWKSYGVQVEVVTDDVTNKSGCESILKKASSLGPIDAIFNLALVLKDAIFENQTPESFAECAKPKAIASQHLDELSRRLCPNLRSFVVFSSVSCGRGNAGQTNYGMSNSVMERICAKRRSEGLPGLAIQWGPIGEVGLVAEMQEENIEINIEGTQQQRISNCLEVLDRLLNQPNAIVSSMVVCEKRKDFKVADNVLDAVANIIGIKDLKTVSHHVTLPELGLDSISGVELKHILQRKFDILLTLQDLRRMTLDQLRQLEETKITEGLSSRTETDSQLIEVEITDILGKFTSDKAIPEHYGLANLCENLLSVEQVEGNHMTIS